MAPGCRLGQHSMPRRGHTYNSRMLVLPSPKKGCAAPSAMCLWRTRNGSSVPSECPGTLAGLRLDHGEYGRYLSKKSSRRVRDHTETIQSRVAGFPAKITLHTAAISSAPPPVGQHRDGGGSCIAAVLQNQKALAVGRDSVAESHRSQRAVHGRQRKQRLRAIEGELGCPCLFGGGPDRDGHQFLIGGEKKELA